MATKADSKLDLVRKLLAKAEGTDSEAEREALNERASQLIATYGIDAAMLAEQDAGSDQLTDRSVDLLPPYARDMGDLLWAICEPLRCKGIRTKRWNRDRGAFSFQMRLFGYESDIDRTVLLYQSLRNQAAAEMARLEIPYYENTAAYRRTFLSGFHSEVSRRLYRAEAAARASQEATEQAARDEALLSDGPLPIVDPMKPVTISTGVDLVLHTRDDKVKAAVEDAHPNAKEAKPRLLSGNGYIDGIHAGERASLGTDKAVSNAARKAVG
jgi:Protein of unknown function (DUF2786)